VGATVVSKLAYRISLLGCVTEAVSSQETTAVAAGVAVHLDYAPPRGDLFEVFHVYSRSLQDAPCPTGIQRVLNGADLLVQ